MKRTIILATAAALAACSMMTREERFPKEVTDEVAQSTRRAAESLTLSRLAALEQSLNAYIQAKGRIPAKLSELVPDFIATVPEVELGIPQHKDSAEVRYYPAAVIVNGGIDGPELSDTGGWGYAYNDRQVIVFVDCTHQRMDGSLWFKARGVY